jgi:hypothetical protein
VGNIVALHVRGISVFCSVLIESEHATEFGSMGSIGVELIARVQSYMIYKTIVRFAGKENQ